MDASKVSDGQEETATLACNTVLRVFNFALVPGLHSILCLYHRRCVHRKATFCFPDSCRSDLILLIARPTQATTPSHLVGCPGCDAWSRKPICRDTQWLARL